MQVLLAVVEDLYTFAVSMLFPWRADSKDISIQLYLPPSRIVSPLRETVEIDTYRQGEHAVQAEMPETAPAKNEESAHLQKTTDVYPAFIIGAENSAREATTVRLRLVIRDEFSAILSQLPLQAHEYVYYKLLRRGVKIAWPDIRPRTPGSWARILSLLPNVTIADTPTAGAVMEYALPEGKAHLAYVEKVFPDQTIHLSEADWPDRGIYNERFLGEDEWRGLNPKFIAVG